MARLAADLQRKNAGVLALGTANMLYGLVNNIDAILEADDIDALDSEEVRHLKTIRRGLKVDSKKLKIIAKRCEKPRDES